MDSPAFDLIETLRFDPDEGLVDLPRHLARLKASAEALDFVFDHHDAANDLQAASFRWRTAARVRLRLSQRGSLAIELAALAEGPEKIEVAIVPLPVAPDDRRLRHKTSDRALYDEPRRAAGTFEVVFARPDGLLTEGSFTSLFVPRADGLLRTPPRDRGLLPGILRARLIDEGRAIEDDLRAGDLAGPFFVGNSLRGLIRASLTRE